MNSTPATERFYRPELDGLRFFAFVAVYIEHTFGFGMGEHHHLPNWIGTALGTIGKAGTFGVDLFFVLSSYLITELLLRERQATGHLDVGRFYIRRILRIWPLYFLFLFFAYALTFLVPTEQLTWKHLLGFMFFAGNWVYFLMPITTVAGPLWSVSLEEQFYLIWPWVIRGSSRRRLALCAASLMVIAFCARLLMGITHPDVDYVSKNSFTRIDGIAVGALLALYLHGETPKLGGAARGALFAASLAMLLFVTYAFQLFTLPVGLWQLAFGWPLGALACGGILMSVLGSTSRVTAPLRSPVFIYLGRISYGLYVYHEVFLLLGSHLFPEHDTRASQMLEYWAFGFCATLPVAMASYQWLELPFLRLKRRRFTVVASRPD